MHSSTAYHIFISATWQDLAHERGVVRDALSGLGLSFLSMEFFGSEPDTPLTTCLRWVDQSDLLILIVAHRYGTISPEADSSFTEAEYQRAIQNGTPCLVYFKDNQAPVLPSYIERDVDRTARLDAFKTHLRNNHTVASFMSADELGRLVVTDVHKHIVRTQVRRAAVPTMSIGISDILPKGMVELVLEGMAHRYGLPIGVFSPRRLDYHYYNPPELHLSYCHHIRSIPRGLCVCEHADVSFSLKSMVSASSLMYRCHAGLIEAAYPIMVNGMAVGAIFGGQFLYPAPEHERFSAVREFAETLGADPDEMLALYRQIKPTPNGLLDALRQEMARVCEYFSKLASERSVYAMESLHPSGRFGTETSLRLLMTLPPSQILRRVGELTKQEFILRLLVPLLEQMGFVNMRPAPVALSAACDLLFEFPTPLGASIRYGVAVCMGEIKGSTYSPGGCVNDFIACGQATLREDFVDQYWVVSPLDMTQGASNAAALQRDDIFGRTVYFLTGMDLLMNLRNHIPVLMEGMLCQSGGVRLLPSKAIDGDE